MVDIAAARVVAVLTRAPSSGGKSRLFEALGCTPDPGLLSALLLDTLDGATAPGVSRVVSVTPASGCDEVASLVPATVDVMPQPDGSLGDRMRGTLAALFARGARAVALVGSDLPELTPVVIEAAFSRLERDQDSLVLGPAADGGYYLIAATRVPDVFDGITWGSRGVLAQTKDAAAASGIPVFLLDMLADVDTPDDLRRVGGTLAASRTAAWMRRHPFDLIN
jgi:rSAM/selenodomain-associated transferase 1